jgi:hypothetical protein
MAKWLAAGHSRTDCSGGGSGRALRDDNALGANATLGGLAVSKNLTYVLGRYLVFPLTIGLWSPLFHLSHTRQQPGHHGQPNSSRCHGQVRASALLPLRA